MANLEDRPLASALSGEEKMPVLQGDGSDPSHFKAMTVSQIADFVVNSAAILETPAATKWRIRFPDSSQDSGVGVGFAEVRFYNGESVISTGGTPFASSNNEVNGYTLAEAFDGALGSGNGWYSANDRAGAYNSYVGYEFASAVLPTKVDFAPLNGFQYTMARTVVVEFQDDSGAWVPVAEMIPNTGADNTYQSVTIPTEYIARPAGGPWAGKTALLIGDSIAAASSPGFADWFARATGLTVVKSATSGDKILDALDDIQARTDLARFDIVIAFIGTNDYWNDGGTALGALGDNEADATFYGYAEQLVTEVLTDAPTTRFVFVTPLRRTDQTAANTNGPSKLLVDYRNALADVAEKYACPVWDAYNLSGINTVNAATILPDGLHPGLIGERIVGGRLGRFVNTL